MVIDGHSQNSHNNSLLRSREFEHHFCCALSKIHVMPLCQVAMVANHPKVMRVPAVTAAERTIAS